MEFAQRENLHAILVNETHLRVADDPKLPNYQLYRNDRPNASGGRTAIYVRWDIDHHVIDTPPIQHLEATIVSLHMANGPVWLIAAYNAPNWRLVSEDLDEILGAEGAAIIAGDLNSKHPDWNSRFRNENGDILKAYIDDRQVSVDATVDPTNYGPRGRPDVLDIVVLKDVTEVHQLSVAEELDFDHMPILLQLGGETEDRDE